MQEPLKKYLSTKSDQVITIETDFDTFIRQYHLLFDGQFSGIVFLNREFELLYSNQYLIDLLNLDISYVYKEAARLSIPSQLGAITPAIYKCMQTMECITMTSKLDLPSQNLPHKFLISIQPVLEASSNEICGTLININIGHNINTSKENYSLHNRIEQLDIENEKLEIIARELYQENDLNHSLINDLMDNSPFGILMINPDKKIIQTNPAAEKILGINQNAIFGQNCKSILECNDNCPFIDNNPQLDRTETIGICGNGTKKTLLRSSTSPRETGHNFMIESFIDISEIKEAQLAIESANTTKDEFIAKMSHELRTPLNAVIGLSDILLDYDSDIPGEELKENIQHIQNAGEHLLKIVNELLDISRISAGKIKLEPEQLDIKLFVDEVIATMSPAFLNNNNKIEIRYKNCPGDIHIDPVRFRQVIDNLLTNACKFTENGNITIHVEKLSITNTEWVQFSISDTGIGIAEENFEKIFDSFEQADNSITRKYGGTGLGLAITRKICVALKGEISVESTLGQGSTFTVKIPCSPEPDNNQLLEGSLNLPVPDASHA